MIQLKDFKAEIKNYSLLRVWRESLGITRREVAKHLQISEDLYSKYERKLNCPNIKNFKKIADFFIQNELENASYEVLLRDMLKDNS